ncbi:hypothetical protein DBV05_g6739 [Lasiodiplodia theobromae]|uniref:NACHT-NTPase and P-loop NTPases N-terminal domain-containing protein n=1 Tax=Lasiodiplodia theobromae TaxID=45133 RepID=A0A5N5D9W4_9PEZI|nr:hypothetical protein DBV05_g6739 [Lasiodiplodia theobromae]
MDGITALSLAVNIIQVVVWGRQVIDVLKGGEIYQTQRDAATNFQNATGSLQKQLSLQSQPITAEDQSLLQIAQTCKTAADNLLKELGPTNDTNRLKLAMKAPFKGPGIKKLDEELAFCQRVLETQLLVGMR